MVDDLAVVQWIAGTVPMHFFRIADAVPIHDLCIRTVVLATIVIAFAANAGVAAGLFCIGLDLSRVRVRAVGERRFEYPADTGRGDSGGAVAEPSFRTPPPRSYPCSAKAANGARMR